ncbi:MAG: FAD:protein FMN transferase [Nocardioides sp.]|nr:FAD:protein FMN transferase [Nocardioides sp.]
MSADPLRGEPTGRDQLIGARRVIEVMGTVFTLDLRDLDPASTAVDEVVDWWRWVDDTFSTYQPDSQVSRLAAGSLTLPECAPEVRHVLDLCRHANESSGGYFTDRPGGALDPSGMVKGWSVEVASQMLRRAGSQHHCISAGGDVRCTGVPELGTRWKVGVADPFNASHLLAVVTAGESPPRGLAVATSGTAQRGHHILDPVTGLLADELASITVVGTDLTVADWAATAAFAMGHEARTWLDAMQGLEGYAVTPGGDYWFTDGFEVNAGLVAAPVTAGRS